MTKKKSTESGQDVLNSLRLVHRKKMLSGIVEGLASSLAVLVASIFLAGLLEMIFLFGPGIRTSLFVASLAAVLLVMYRKLLPGLIGYLRPPRTSDLLGAALEVGETFPDVKDRLRNAVELMSAGPDAAHSKDLTEEYIRQTLGHASSLELENAVRHRPGKRPGYFLAAALAGAAFLLIAFPSGMPSALQRTLNFTHSYVRPSSYSMKILPGDAELSRGDTLKIRVKLSLLNADRYPPHVTVSERYDDEKDFERHRVTASAAGEYTFILPNVRSSMIYYVSAGTQESPDYSVKVVDLPAVRSFTVSLMYPRYTGKAPETLQENIGDFSALVGTRAEFRLQTNKDLAGAWIFFNDSSRVRLETSGATAEGAFRVTRSSEYTLRLLDTDSLANRDPISYAVKAVDDQYPTCTITYPGKDVILNRDMILPLRISIGDDYGFTKLLLQYRLIHSKYVPPEKEYHSIEIPLPSRSAGEQEISYTWDLSSRNLVPEDVISYHARVFDNDMVHGPKSTASGEYTLRLPSLQEVFSEADSEHSDLVSRTEDALNNSDELKQQLDKISEEMKTATKQMSWEQEKKMGNTLQRYDSLQKKVEGIKKQIQNMTRKMLENKIISPQTLEKYMKLQKALQDVNSPEFQEALKKLQQAIQSLNPNQVREALKNFQINDEMLRKSIERTLSLIRRIQIEQKFDELQARLDQMLDRQEKVEKATGESDSTNPQVRRQLSESQHEIGKELAEANRATSDLKKMMSEFSQEMPLKQLDQAKESLEKSGAAEKMREAGNQLSAGQFSNSLSNQKQASSAMREFKQQLAQTQKSMQRNQQRATMDALRKTQQNLLEISREQESLRDHSKNVIPNSAETRALSERQNELMQQLGYAAQQMMQLSNKSFAVTPRMGQQIGEAYSKMQQSLGQLQSRNGQSPTGSQTDAMASLNKAVMKIQGTLQSMMNGQGGGGLQSLMQQLEGIGANQEGLNALTRQLAEHGALSMQQQAEIARLAARQEAIRKSLEQLARESERSQSQDRMLGNLDNIGKEMSRVANDLKGKNISPETIRRQERILTHLLDASRSMRTQDYDNRRVTRAGKDVITRSPGPLNLTNARSAREQELLKLIRENFPPEYQKIILKYYHLLQKSPE